MFSIEVNRLRIIRILTFSVKIVDLFQRNQLVAGCYVSIKNSIIEVVQTIMTKSKRVVIEREIFLKDSSLNNARLAEVVILLDFIQILSNKSYKMSIRTITMLVNNNKVQLIVHGSIRVANYFIQEAAAEISTIQRLIKQIPIQVQIDKVRGHSQCRETFE